ncbi:transport inhibitor response 1-like protein [Curcuma longa]|uniref:transport inhibitor response 1-like protein n=1 Tax=Curcuma longa TaxID=136217 RepID=UPI003D9DE8CC
MARVEEAGDRDENKEEETSWWSPEAVEGGRGGEGPSGGSRGGGGGGGDGDGGRPDTQPQPPPPPPYSDQVLENVLENVLQFLVCRRDRNAASLVCRSWYRSEAQTRRELFVGNCYAVSPARALRRFCGARALVLKGRPRFADFNLFPLGWGARFSPWISAMASASPWLERVCLKRMTVSDADLAFLARSFPSFCDLTLICCDGFGTPGLAVIAELCRNLRVLDLIENDVEDEDEEVVDWISRFPETTTSLESLSFECVNCPVNFSALEALVARSPSLRRLRVNQNVSLGQLRRLMVRAPHLTHLGTGSFRSGIDEDLNATDLEQAFLASKSLICLSGFREVAPEYLLAVLPVCANLVSLNLSYAVITAEQLKPVMLECHNLRTFWVLDTVGDEGLRTVAKACKNLHELRVFPFEATEDSEGSVSDAGLVAISNGCRKLRSILFFCQRMTNAAVVTMSKNCPDLVVFRLCIMGRHRPDHVTGESMDEGFGAIVMNCKKLTRLAVSGLLTDKVFEYIATYGKLVRTLSVAFAGNTDLSLKYVLEGCHRLQKLEIRDSPFGDAGLLSGIHHYYNMRFLWMSSCKLSLNGCKEVAQRMPNLVVEVIGDRPKDLDSDTVEKLYLYRSLEGPRDDAPPFVSIL